MEGFLEGSKLTENLDQNNRFSLLSDSAIMFSEVSEVYAGNCYDQQQPKRMMLIRKHWDSSEDKKEDDIEREQSKSLPVRYK
jgi:hypothetical protein